MKNKIFYYMCVLTFVLINGCSPKRDLVYFSNLANTASVSSPENQEVRIKPNDLVTVTMHSLNAESDNLFISRSATVYAPLKIDGYKVSKTGFIEIPIIGNFKIEGMTVGEAREAIVVELRKKVKEPLVDVQLMNFKITVIGEVNKPSTFIITGEKINVLEALGLAGDMTVYGKRENVLIIRNENGNKILKRLNLNDKDTFNSPYFYLRQNDIVYVEPDRSKAVEYSQNTRIMPLIIASISALAVLTAVVLKR